MNLRRMGSARWVERVGSKTVAQSAQRNHIAEVCPPGVALYDLPESLPGKSIPKSIKEQSVFIFPLGKLRPGFFQISL